MVNGLLGAGSGVLVVLALRAVLGSTSADSRDLFANATAVVLALSLSSTVSYLLLDRLPATDLARYLVPAVVGGMLGAYLLGRLSERLVQCIFSTLVLFSGMVMLLR